MKRYTLSFIVLVSAFCIPFLLIHSGEKGALSGEQRITRAMLNKALASAIYIAENNYYKPVDSDVMYQGAIKGALAALGDSYTYLLSHRAHQRSVENLYNAEFGGLGIRIYKDYRGFIKISKPLSGTPAQAVGLQAGDYITKVNGKPIHLSQRTGMTSDDVIDLLRGKIGTDVTITVQRGLLQPFDITLTRARISISSVNSTMLEDDVGYIRITEFIGSGRKGGTEEKFGRVLEAHKAAGMKALILDLRGNQGGLLNGAYHIADAFIDKGLIVSTKGLKNEFDEEYPATSKLLCDADIPLVVLVNQYSASASEIVAGAIKDTGRGLLIGQKTFGKGVVQKRYPLGEIGAMSLTISSYYTPNGTSIDKEGITPHVPVVPEKLELIEQTMRRMVAEKNVVEDFVTKWVEDELKRTGEIPKDFAKLEVELPELKEKVLSLWLSTLNIAEAELPKLSQALKETSTGVNMEWLKQRAEQLFNLNVGIEKVVNLEYDRELQEALRIIKAGDIEKYITEATERMESLAAPEISEPATGDETPAE